MSSLLYRADQAVSATDMARNFGTNLRRVTSGAEPHLVVFKDNIPAAVLLSVEAFQAMQDELAELRTERVAIDRLAGADGTTPVSLEELEKRFG